MWLHDYMNPLIIWLKSQVLILDLVHFVKLIWYFFVSDPTAQFCFPDQVLNIHSFSMLRSWLQHFTFASSTSPSPRSGHSPLISATASQSGSVDNLSQSIHFSDSPSGHHTLDQSQSSMDNISIGSQSSTGFIIPLSRSSPQESGAHSVSRPLLLDNWLIKWIRTHRQMTVALGLRLLWVFPLILRRLAQRSRHKLQLSNCDIRVAILR